MRSNLEVVTLGNRKFEVSRFKLKKWLELEDIRITILKAVDNKEFVSNLYSYLSTALDFPKDELSELPWYEVALAYKQICSVNFPGKDFPIFKSKSDAPKSTWDYEGRIWYHWCHLLANAYGWTVEYVAELDVDDAIAFIEEILVEDQLEKEWQWSLTELAYPYNEHTKKSVFKPLPRPTWMEAQKPPPVEKMKMPKYLIPIGIINRGNAGKIQ